MKSSQNKAATLFCMAMIVIVLPAFLSSCQIKEILSNSDVITAGTQTETSSPQSINDASVTDNSSSSGASEDSLVFFDYKKIKLDVTTAIGVKMKNCNLVLDYFGNLNFLGEIENISSSSKTSMLITFEFYDKKTNLFFPVPCH